MTVEVYSDSTVVEKGNNQLHLLLDKGAYLLYEITAETWDECMKIYHKNNGWEDYIPMK
jgi:hypothetical protein